MTKHSKSNKFFFLQDNYWCTRCSVYLLSVSSVIDCLLERQSRLGQIKFHLQWWFWGQTVSWTVVTETVVCFPIVIAATVWKSLQSVVEPKIRICIPGRTIWHHKTQRKPSKGISSLGQFWIFLALRFWLWPLLDKCKAG